METLPLADALDIRRLVFRWATPLIYAQWRCAFEDGRPEEALDILACYQNGDGGFGHALEANCWNPDSSPYVTGLAIQILGGLYGAEYSAVRRDHPVFRGILAYLGSGAHATEAGWLGMALPGNNRHSHAPWFHHDPSAPPGETDPGPLVDFILRHGNEGDALWRKALAIRERLPARKPAPDLSRFDPSQFICWEPMPSDIVDSPASPLYPEYKDLVDAQMDGIVRRLRETKELPVPGVDTFPAFPEPPPWLDNRQVISCYAATCGFFCMQMRLLKKFGRLGFALPLKDSP